MIYKKEVVTVLRAVVDESLEVIKAHVEWIDKHREDVAIEQVAHQLATHLSVLHEAFPVITRLFTKRDLESICSLDFLQRLEKLYAAHLIAGNVVACDCDYCKNIIDNACQSNDSGLVSDKSESQKLK